MSKLDTVFSEVDISTRPKRRIAVSLIISELVCIRNKEEEYMDRIPANMQGGNAYVAADYSVDSLTDVILLLMEAY